jgi:hypothetical protein|tara:strand:+ start:267 stop:473 length:207 start_codon:yes stop_codon:yes gene_type:complete
LPVVAVLVLILMTLPQEVLVAVVLVVFIQITLVYLNLEEDPHFQLLLRLMQLLSVVEELVPRSLVVKG